VSVTLAGVLPQRHRLASADWDAIIDSYVTATGEDVVAAETLLDQTIGFVAASAGNPGVPLAMSTIVDPMWEHVIDNFDQAYRELCASFGADYIGHEPLVDAAAAMRASGSTVVEVVWNGEYECIVGNGC
jgi:hypothetical protein